MSGKKSVYDKFDNTCRQVVIRASAATMDAEIDCIYPEAFIIGILLSGANDVTSILLDLDVDLEKCLKTFKGMLIEKKEPGSRKVVNYDDLKKSKEVIRACETANRISIDLNSEEIKVQHIFMSLLQISEDIEKVFKEEGFDISNFLSNIDLTTPRSTARAVAGTGAHISKVSKKNKALKTFCTDVTQQAKDNELDPIISREREIEIAITILCRRVKNNPILLGKPGVGKTAIVEGIAQRIVSGTVPKQLLKYKIYSLSLSSVVAGTKYRGEFEERLQALVDEIQNNPECILFIDEIHTLVGAGGAGSALDASNILKPFLARGTLKCIGATTLEDYKKHFQTDGALVRRFQQILVEEPDIDQMHKILNGVKHKFEKYHDCIISEDAIDAMVTLSDRYMSNKNFPDILIVYLILA